MMDACRAQGVPEPEYEVAGGHRPSCFVFIGQTPERNSANCRVKIRPTATLKCVKMIEYWNFIRIFAKNLAKSGGTSAIEIHFIAFGLH